MTTPLRDLRKRAYLSAGELADKAGVSRDTIWRVESGKTPSLRPSTVRKIADALGVPPAEIAEFHIEGEETNRALASPAEWEALIRNAREFGIVLGRHPIPAPTPEQLAEVDERAERNDRAGWYADDPDGSGLWSGEREAPIQERVSA